MADAESLPRVEQCPKCGDAVLRGQGMRRSRSDSMSFWGGFFFGWIGVLWAGLRRGKSGVDHAAAGCLINWMLGIAIMLLLIVAALIRLWIISK